MLTKVTDTIYIDVEEIAKVEVFNGKNEDSYGLHLKYKNQAFGVEKIHPLTKDQLTDFLYKIDTHTL